jgi:signal transduction histidine kinase
MLGQSRSLDWGDRRFWKAKLERLLESGGRQEFETEVVDGAGQRRVIHFTMVLLGDFQDGTTAIGVVGKDTTGLRSLQSELERCQGERRAFVSAISHDLRTPIVSVQGFANLLLKKYNDRLDEKGIQYLDRLKHEADRMDRLLRDAVGASEALGSEGAGGT